jgi:glutathione S-transferase
MVAVRALGDGARIDGEGTHDAMIIAIEAALAGRAFVLGDSFSIADVIFGGTIRYMLRFGMLEASH